MPVPYALLPKVDAELDRLESEGVIKRVERSDWASPIVCVLKKDGAIRICCDFKVSVNQVLFDNPYPLPDVEDMFATMGTGTMFSQGSKFSTKWSHMRSKFMECGSFVNASRTVRN
jgi:hypothetical protein